MLIIIVTQRRAMMMSPVKGDCRPKKIGDQMAFKKSCAKKI